VADLRLAELSSRYTAELDARAGRLLSTSADGDQLPANMLHQPGAVHRAVMKAVDDVLTMGLAHPEVNAAPVALRSAVRLLRRLEPLMLEELAKVPEAECLQMMRGLAASITELADGVDATHANDTLSVVPPPDQRPQPAQG
jgi:hypothetical protein